MKKILCLLLSFVMIFATTPVLAETDIPVEISVMQQFGYVQGDENGNLNLKDSITRAEFSAILVRVLDANNISYSTQVFEDVPLTHWGANYIAACYSLGIINGYGDGKFGPEDTVTYEQAVKMVVCALGYEPMALAKGTYPTGYLAVANQIKITENVRNNTRGDVMTLIYNALTTPKMAQTSFGSLTIFEPLDDADNYTTILTEQDIAVATGIVGAVNVIDGNFEFNITENSEDYSFTIGTKTFEIGNSAISNYVNESVILYLKDNGRYKYEVIAIEPTYDNEILVINASDLKETNVGTNGKWEYYATLEATRTTKIDVDANAKAFVNGNEFNISDSYLENIADLDAVIKFIENDNTKGYDVVDITIYEHAIVEEVVANRGRIECLDGEKISYDIDDDNLIVNIYNAGGSAIDLEDICEGDVLAIVVKEITSNGTPISASHFTEEIAIYDLGENYVKGTINMYNDDDKTIYIDNNPYEYNEDLVSEKDFLKENEVVLGTEGVFYLGVNGKVIGFDGIAGASGNYAFILQGAIDNSDWDNRYQVKLLLANGSIKTYYVDEDVDYNCGLSKWTKGGNIDGRLVEYKVNSKGVISKLEEVGNGKEVEPAEFKANTEKIGGCALASDVSIFNVDVANVDDASIIGLDSLVDEGIYSGYVFMKDGGEYEIFVLLDGAERFDAEAPLCIVDSVVQSIYEDDDCYKVTYYCGEEEYTAIFTSDSDKYADCSLDYETLKKGSLFVANTAADGLVSKYMVLANVEGTGYNVTDFDDRFNATYSDNDVAYIYAPISKIDKKYITFEGIEEDIVIDASAAQYYYNAEGNKPKLEIGDWYGANVDEENGNYAFVKLYDDEVTDIIAFSFEN